MIRDFCHSLDRSKPPRCSSQKVGTTGDTITLRSGPQDCRATTRGDPALAIAEQIELVGGQRTRLQRRLFASEPTGRAFPVSATRCETHVQSEVAGLHASRYLGFPVHGPGKKLALFHVCDSRARSVRELRLR